MLFTHEELLRVNGLLLCGVTHGKMGSHGAHDAKYVGFKIIFSRDFYVGPLVLCLLAVSTTALIRSLSLA